MEAGKLDRKITIQSFTASQSSYGEPVQTWSDYKVNIWARVEPLSMRESFFAQQVGSVATTKFTIRFFTGIEPMQRVVFAGQNYNIEAVINPDNRNRELMIIASRLST